ncbi:MAG: polysaccharide biosynthesis protein [Phycisphaerales bacterium]
MTTPIRAATRPKPVPAVTLVRRALLIGTPATIQLTRDQLALVDGGPEPIGCILLDAVQPRAGGGLPVFGAADALATAIHEHHPDLAVVSLPTTRRDDIARIRTELARLGVPERFLPPLGELLDNPPTALPALLPATSATLASRLDLAELIGRAAHEIDRVAVGRVLAGKRVLITGAGGSIGAELARVVASFGPEQLQLMDRSENALFEIDRVIARLAPGLPRRTILHDVVDADQTLALLVDLKPNVVFHAAAHKHVPLMEDHPSHAVTNNLFGTKSIADAAAAVGAERFVFVSTDKAVNPTSVMGATKRLAEMYAHWAHEASRRIAGEAECATRFSIVRFGNVVGSACSVLTIWSAQLAEGGPISVTDPRMTRYFMTIPEAAALVVQSAALEPGPGPAHAGRSAAVYVLDMGAPIRILDLAERFARAHGFEPRVADADRHGLVRPPAPTTNRPTMEVVFTGIRPGEKLYEELSYEAEDLRPTDHAGINAWAGPAPRTNCASMIADLGQVRTSRDRDAVLAAIRRHVPEMTRTAAAR